MDEDYDYLYYPSKSPMKFKEMDNGEEDFIPCSVISIDKKVSQIKIPDFIGEFKGIIEIGEKAFEDSAIEEIKFPKVLKTIRTMAFAFCRNLKSIETPDNITTIETGAFYGCENLREITLGEGITEIPSLAFSHCKNLRKIIFKGKVLKIGSYAFESCNSLSSMNLPKNLETIEDFAFKDCDNLTEIFIPNSIKEIQNNVFSGCTNLKKVNFENSNLPECHFDNWMEDCGAEILYNQKPIDSTTIEINNEDDFELPTQPENDPDSNKFLESKRKSIKPLTEEEAESILDFKPIDDETCSVKLKPFMDIKEIIIPSTYKQYKVKHITNAGFADSNLTSVIISDGIESIGDYAFSNKTLVYIFIPSSVKKIGKNIFITCNNLKLIAVEANQKPTDWKDDWNSTLSNNNVTTFDSSKDGFEDFGITVHQNGLKFTFLSKSTCEVSLSDRFMTDCTIPSIILNHKVIRIEQEGFKDSLIETLVLPETLEQICKESFRGCEKLTKVIIPNNVKEIGDNAFYECNSLQTLVLGSGLTRIGDHAFFATKLTSLKIPQNVSYIENSAFSCCFSLRDVYCEFPEKPSTWADDIFGSQTPTIHWKNDKTESKNDSYDLNTQRNDAKFSFQQLSYASCSVALQNKDAKSALIQSTYNSMTVTEIEKEGFSDSSIETIALPKSCIIINSNAFRDCKGLSEITIPSSVTFIGKDAFNGCMNLCVIKLETNQIPDS